MKEETSVPTLQSFVASFAEALEVETASGLNGETQFRQLPEWESLAVLKLLAMVDEVFGVWLEAEAISRCASLEELYQMILEPTDV